MVYSIQLVAGCTVGSFGITDSDDARTAKAKTRISNDSENSDQHNPQTLISSAATVLYLDRCNLSDAASLLPRAA